MINLIRCPHCEKKVGVSQDVPLSAEVECSLCDGSFFWEKIESDALPMVRVRNSTQALDANHSFDSVDLNQESGPLIDAAIFGSATADGVATEIIRSDRKTKSSRRISPLMHLFGIVFFGFVGLLLGLAVLLFLGKAEPILQLLPEGSIQDWLWRVNSIGGGN